MPFRAQCPTCEKSFTFAQSELGREVRCPNCDDLFVARAAPDHVDPTPAGAGDTSTTDLRDLNLDVPRLTVQALGAPSAPSQTGVQDSPRQVGASMSECYAWLAIALLFVAVVGLGLGRTLLVPPAAPPAPPLVALPPAPAALPPEIVRGLAKLRADLEGKGVPARPFKLPPPLPTAAPKSLNDALALTHDPNWLRRKTAAEWLAKAPVVENRRGDVCQALVAMLRTPDLFQHDAAADALLVWADAETKTQIVELAKDESSSGARTALFLLARMSEPRAAPIAARQLGNFFKRPNAVRVLEKLGPLAEKDVAAYLEKGDLLTRTEVCRVLGSIGTPASLPALETAADKDPAVAEPAREAMRAIQRRAPKEKK